MPRISPLNPEDLSSEMMQIFEFATSNMGFAPNDVLTMAIKPDLLQAMTALFGAVFGPGKIDPAFKHLIGEIASKSAGCQYCTAHNAHGASLAGIPQEKIDALWEYERSDLFTEAEKAALAFAQGAGQSPNGVTDEDFATLKQHYSDEQIVEILSVVGMFGFLNRWNDSLATKLEDAPREFAEKHLADKGWTNGKHS